MPEALPIDPRKTKKTHQGAENQGFCLSLRFAKVNRPECAEFVIRKRWIQGGKPNGAKPLAFRRMDQGIIPPGFTSLNYSGR